MELEQQNKRNCAFIRPDGSSCPGSVEGEGALCYWHDDSADKRGAEVKNALEEWAATGKSMEGFVLCGASLEGVRLSNPELGYDMRGANFLRANLRDANLLGAF